MNFGEVIEKIRDGQKRAARPGWHGKGMFIYVELGKTIPFSVLREPQKSWLKGDMKVLPHFNLFTDGVIVTGWLASQTDMLALDWVLLDS